MPALLTRMSTSPRLAFAEHARDAFRIGDVANECDRVVADLVRDLFDLFGSSRGNSDARALACECECDRATDTTTTAGDECCF